MNTNTVKYRKINVDLRADCRGQWNAPHWGPALAVLLVLAAAGVPAIRAAIRHARRGLTA
jgi:hypothetical protein